LGYTCFEEFSTSVPMDELVDLVSLLVVFCFLVDSAQ